ncbi:MAG: cupin domain-containing protein [Lautropia sp.]|nr:cupin domain-containing protein [Lautropia sp.]
MDTLANGIYIILQLVLMLVCAPSVFQVRSLVIGFLKIFAVLLPVEILYAVLLQRPWELAEGLQMAALSSVFVLFMGAGIKSLLHRNDDDRLNPGSLGRWADGQAGGADYPDLPDDYSGRPGHLEPRSAFPLPPEYVETSPTAQNQDTDASGSLDSPGHDWDASKQASFQASAPVGPPPSAQSPASARPAVVSGLPPLLSERKVEPLRLHVSPDSNLPPARSRLSADLPSAHGEVPVETVDPMGAVPADIVDTGSHAPPAVEAPATSEAVELSGKSEAPVSSVAEQKPEPEHVSVGPSFIEKPSAEPSAPAFSTSVPSVSTSSVSVSPVPLAEFLNEAATPSQARSETDKPFVIAKDVPPHRYPTPFVDGPQGRVKRPLGEPFGLTHFDVILSSIEAGGSSGLRHSLDGRDAFIYILEGVATLITDEGAFLLEAGSCAGFKEGVGNSYKIRNDSEQTLQYLEIDDRSAQPGRIDVR